MEQPNAMTDSEHHRNRSGDRRAERRFHTHPEKRGYCNSCCCYTKFTEFRDGFIFAISNFCCGVNAVFFILKIRVYIILLVWLVDSFSMVWRTPRAPLLRPMYGKTLRYMKSYVENDLRRLKTNPAELLASKPSEDPLEVWGRGAAFDERWGKQYP